MDWDDNIPDGKDSVTDFCRTEEFSVKQPAFEVVGDCNRTLLSDISSGSCYAAIAFDRGLVQNESGHRDFIARTKYYHFISRRSYAAGSVCHDPDAVQPDSCDSPSIPCTTSRQLRLPVRLASVLKKSPKSRSKSGAVRSTSVPQGNSPYGRRDIKFEVLDDSPSKHSSTKESNCKRDLLEKKTRKLRRDDLVGCDIIGSIYSASSNNSLKGGNRVIHSNSAVHVKSEVIDTSLSPNSKPDVLASTVIRRGRKKVSAADFLDSFGEIVGNTDETSKTVSAGYEHSRGSGISVDVKTTVGLGCVKSVASDSVDPCSESSSVLSVDSDLTNVSENSNRGRRRGQMRKPGDANNNRGKMVGDFSASASVCASASLVSEPEHLKDVCQLIKTEPGSANDSQQDVSAQTRAHTSANTSNVSSTCRRGRMTATVLKPQRLGADSKLKVLRKYDQTASKQTHATGQQKSHFLLRPNECTSEQTVAKTDITAKDSRGCSSQNASDVTDAQNKAQRSILKQLESSEGYIAEKKTKYSSSADLFDDSSLLSREQRALRVGNVLLSKADVISIMGK